MVNVFDFGWFVGVVGECDFGVWVFIGEGNWGLNSV